MDDVFLQCLPVPVNAEARLGRGDAMAVLDAHGGMGHEIELRDKLEPATVRYGAAERQVQLHQEMRADRHIERLRHVRDLEPGRDAGDASNIDLYDRAGAGPQIVLELADAVHGFADGDRNRGCFREALVSRQVIGMYRLLEPGEIEIREARGAANRLVKREALVGVGHHFPIVADGGPHGGDALYVLRDMGTTDLELGTTEAPFLRLERLLDQLRLIDVQPAALGIVELDPILGTPGRLVQRQVSPPGAQVP